MKTIFENHFADLVIFGEPLGLYIPNYTKDSFIIKTDKFKFTFVDKCYISLEAYNMFSCTYFISDRISIDNINGFYMEYCQEVFKILAYLKESLTSIKEAMDLKEKAIKELEDAHKMLIFL